MKTIREELDELKAMVLDVAPGGGDGDDNISCQVSQQLKDLCQHYMDGYLEDNLEDMVCDLHNVCTVSYADDTYMTWDEVNERIYDIAVTTDQGLLDRDDVVDILDDNFCQLLRDNLQTVKDILQLAS